MNKLTAEMIAPYLPHGLQMIFEGKGGRVITLTGVAIQSGGEVTITNGSGAMWLNHSKFVPLLRPLSQLTKEITHNGETFVPIVELAKIGESDHFADNELAFKGSEKTQAVAWTEKAIRYVFAYSMEGKGFFLESIPHQRLIIANQNKLFSKLHEWHFDLYDLLPNNLAVGID